jgi:signal transduction histidine kinase
MELGHATVDTRIASSFAWGSPCHSLLSSEPPADERRHALLEAILAGVPEPIVVVDGSAHPMFTSAGYDRLTLMYGTELTFLDEAGEAMPSATSPLKRAARGESADLEVHLPGPHGELHLYQVAVRPIGVPRPGEATGIVTFRDLGERQLRLRQERFLALVAHELRTPLSGIRGYAELLTGYIQDELPADEVQVVAGRVDALAERLDVMLSELLDVARISNGKLRIRRRMCDLRDVVRTAAELAQARSAMPCIGLHLPAETVPAEVDPNRLGEVVLNLLTNAIKHATGASRIDAWLAVTPDGVEIAVEDDGMGIPADDLPHIFNRHYQVLRDHAHGDATDGLGLGLFIAQQTVAAHGGHLDVESTPGVGTRFTIRLSGR